MEIGKRGFFIIDSARWLDSALRGSLIVSAIAKDVSVAFAWDLKRRSRRVLNNDSNNCSKKIQYRSSVKLFIEPYRPMPYKTCLMSQRQFLVASSTFFTDCNWFTYFPHLSYCQLLFNCSTIDEQFCGDCLSGQVFFSIF